jgi:hypothetical protein
MQTETIQPFTPGDPLQELRQTGEALPAELRERILNLGEAAVQPLIAVLENEDLALEDSPTGGWPPIHAVDLLVDLGSAAAVKPLLHILQATDWNEILHDRILLRLHELGPAVLEPALRDAQAARTEGDEDSHDALCAVLAELGVKDERIWVELCSRFERDDDGGALCFGDYGDPRALPLIEQAIRNFESDEHGQFALTCLATLVDEHDRFGASLPDDLLERVERLRGQWSARFRERFVEAEPVPTTKIGRNEPCPCGSGKKYKKCCGA